MILFIKIDRKQHKQENTILIIHYINVYHSFMSQSFSRDKNIVYNYNRLVGNRWSQEMQAKGTEDVIHGHFISEIHLVIAY